MGMFDDLIPTGPKVPPKLPAARQGMFDDLIPSKAGPGAGAAAAIEPDLGPYPLQEQRESSWLDGTVFSDLLKGFGLEQSAAGQGTYPEVREGKGEFSRPLLGEGVIRDDGSEWVRTPAGETLPLDSEKHVALWDDATGRVLVFKRTPETEESPITSLGRLVMQGMGPGPAIISRTPMAATAILRGEPSAGRVAAVETFNARRANEAAVQAGRVADAEAFRDLDVPIFPPALGDKGTARMARAIEELPVVGRSVKTPRNLTEQGMARVQEEITQGLGAAGDAEAAGLILARPGERTLAMQSELARLAGAPASPESAGMVAQQALQRFRNAPIAEIEPGILRQGNINPTHPIAPANIMSRDAAQRMAEAVPLRTAGAGGIAQTHRGVDVPMARTRTDVLGQSRAGEVRARTSASDMSDAELQALARLPARGTSFAAKQEALYEQARRLIPSELRVDGSVNPQRVAAVNTRQAMVGVERQIANQIAGQGTIGGDLAERIMNHNAHFSVGDLSAIRTEVGRSLSNFNPMIASLDRAQLRTLYAALSRDIELGLIDISNRAWTRTRIAGNRPNRATLEEARRADAALYAFRRADRFTRAGMGRMERLLQLAGAENPADAARKLGRMLEQSSSNSGAVDSVQSMLRAPEWQQVSAFMVSRWGAGKAQDIVRDFMRLTPQAQRQIVEAVPAHLRGQMRTMLEQSARLQRAGLPQGEEGSRSLNRLIKEKTADHDRFRAAMAALEPAERTELAGYLIAQLGKARAGAKEAESSVFNAANFMTDWEALGERGQNLLLSYIPDEAAAKLRQLVRVSGRMKYYETTKNYSGSTYTAFGLGGLGSLATFDPFIVTGMLASYGGAGLTGKLLTSSRYLNWLVKTQHLKRTRGLNKARWTAHVNGLRTLLLADPKLMPLASVLAEDGVAPGDNDAGAEGGITQQQRQKRGME